MNQTAAECPFADIIGSSEFLKYFLISTTPFSNAEELSDAEIEELIHFRFDHEREGIDLEEEFYDNFLEVLPTGKVARLMKAENDFKRYLLKQMHSQRQERARPGR